MLLLRLLLNIFCVFIIIVVLPYYVLSFSVGSTRCWYCCTTSTSSHFGNTTIIIAVERVQSCDTPRTTGTAAARHHPRRFCVCLPWKVQRRHRSSAHPFVVALLPSHNYHNSSSTTTLLLLQYNSHHRNGKTVLLNPNRPPLLSLTSSCPAIYLSAA